MKAINFIVQFTNIQWKTVIPSRIILPSKLIFTKILDVGRFARLTAKIINFIGLSIRLPSVTLPIGYGDIRAVFSLVARRNVCERVRLTFALQFGMLFYQQLQVTKLRECYGLLLIDVVGNPYYAG